MACQVLRCGRPDSPSGAGAVPPSYRLCGEHRAAIDDGAPWAVHGAGSLLVGPDALYDLPRVVKRLRARLADTVQVVDGAPRELVQLDLTTGLEGTTDADRELSVVLPAHTARALGVGLLELADEADGL